MLTPERHSILGERLRKLRKEQKLSLAKLCESSGVSISMLSHIERGQTTPSLRSLSRICYALGVEMTDVFPTIEHENEDEITEIVRANERSELEFKSFGLTKKRLSPIRSKSLEFFMITLDPNGGSGPEPLVRQGEKAGIVIRGTVNLLIGNKQHILSEGDSFQFNSSKPHRILNNSSTPTEILWIIKPDYIIGDL